MLALQPVVTRVFIFISGVVGFFFSYIHNCIVMQLFIYRPTERNTVTSQSALRSPTLPTGQCSQSLKENKMFPGPVCKSQGYLI
jgi:hypothetical protein